MTYRLADRASSKPGWNKMDGKWYYYDAEDNMKTGWVKDGSWYYLDASGVMQQVGKKLMGYGIISMVQVLCRQVG